MAIRRDCELYPRYHKGAMPTGSSIDEIIDLYKRDVDVTLIDECLRRTVEQRLQALQSFSSSLDELRAEIVGADDQSQ